MVFSEVSGYEGRCEFRQQLNNLIQELRITEYRQGLREGLGDIEATKLAEEKSKALYAEIFNMLYS